MRISATGRAEGGRLSQHFGFTLVELLIVLTLIGLLSAAVVIAMPDPRGGLTAEAERFAATAKGARDAAILDATAMSIRVTETGYGFDRREAGEWKAMDRKPFADQRWRHGTSAAMGPEGVARIVFDPTGIGEPARVTLVRGDEQIGVVIAADGAIHVDR